MVVHPPKRMEMENGMENKAAFVGYIWRSLQIGTAFTLRCDVIGLQHPLKDAAP